MFFSNDYNDDDIDGYENNRGPDADGDLNDGGTNLMMTFLSPIVSLMF